MDAEKRWEELKKWLNGPPMPYVASASCRAARIERQRARDKMTELEAAEKRNCGWCHQLPWSCGEVFRYCSKFRDRRHKERRKG